MSARITPLRLEAFEQLPQHARRCVFWEVDPSTLQGVDAKQSSLADPEFEKEAWLSMVLLEWGSCGQLAVPSHVDLVPEVADVAAPAVSGDEPCLGFALYAPPRAIPRAGLFPTGPVSADAVLLTTVGVESDTNGTDGDGLTRALLAAVVGDLVRRGVRALEAFGRTAEATELVDTEAVPPDLQPAVHVLGDCSLDQCIVDADILGDVGFEIVAPHRYFPRMRLELEQGLGWKADVEAALERLLESARLQQPIGAGASPYG